MKKILLHIETAPLPIGELVIKAPTFKAASNLKDAAKITEDIEKKKNKYFEEAAYSENTGRICAIAFKRPDEDLITFMTSLKASEEEMIKTLRELFKTSQVITFRGVKFTYPFIARRSAAYEGLSLFNTDYLYDPNYTGRVNSKHIDLAQIWACGGLSHPESIKEITDVLGIEYDFSNKPIHKLLLEEDGESKALGYITTHVDALEDVFKTLLC